MSANANMTADSRKGSVTVSLGEVKKSLNVTQAGAPEDNTEQNTVNTAPNIADQTFSVPENAMNGTEVGTVLASDAETNNLMFAITSGNTGDVFDINQTTGAITTAGALDFEITQSYTLKVSVSDGSLSATADIIINVTDVEEITEPVNTAPTITDQTFSVPEDAVNGTEVGTVQASDAETNNLMFAITAGNTGNAFAIGEGTGAITTAGTLDFENTQSYTLKVSVSDGELSATADITVNVTDVDETAATRQAIANDIETLKGKQDGHLRTTNIADAQMKIAALKMESLATAATYKAAIDAIAAVTALDGAAVTALQGEIDAISAKITALENAGNAPAGTIPPLKTSLEARKTAQKVLSNGASGLTTELRKITVSEETKTMALLTELNKSLPDWDIVLMLINEGADVNARNRDRNTALSYMATIGGDNATSVVNSLIDAGANVNIRVNGQNTALIIAAVFSRTAIVKVLLAVDGIKVNAIGNSNLTALDVAANEAIKAALRKAGAKTKAQLDSE
ncbi:MAG: cadherin domain-containing protein [Ekhidna sp.]|nr:cadherin domain-containing protein [Ekhidna sp.]